MGLGRMSPIGFGMEAQQYNRAAGSVPPGICHIPWQPGRRHSGDDLRHFRQQHHQQPALEPAMTLPIPDAESPETNTATTDHEAETPADVVTALSISQSEDVAETAASDNEVSSASESTDRRSDGTAGDGNGLRPKCQSNCLQPLESGIHRRTAAGRDTNSGRNIETRTGRQTEFSNAAHVRRHPVRDMSYDCPVSQSRLRRSAAERRHASSRRPLIRRGSRSKLQFERLLRMQPPNALVAATNGSAATGMGRLFPANFRRTARHRVHQHTPASSRTDRLHY